MNDSTIPHEKCWACREPLKHDCQRKCLECGSWLGRRRWLYGPITTYYLVAPTSLAIVASFVVYVFSSFAQHFVDVDITVQKISYSIVTKVGRENYGYHLNLEFKNNRRALALAPNSVTCNLNDDQIPSTTNLVFYLIERTDNELPFGKTITPNNRADFYYYLGKNNPKPVHSQYSCSTLLSNFFGAYRTYEFEVSYPE